MDKRGNDEAIDCDMKVVERSRLYEIKMISSLLNIHGDDVAAVMKYQQVNPWNLDGDYVIDIKNINHAILTCPTCGTLFAMEKEGKGREGQQCHVVCPKFFSIMAHYFNPNIKVTPVKLPPRKNKDDICCQWEFKLER